MNKRFLKHSVDMLFISSGSLLMALAYNWFLIPHKVVPGGVTGIAMILNYFLHTPVGAVNIVLNIPLFVLGIRVLGKTYGIKSFLGLLLSSLTIDFFSYVMRLQPATNNPMLACLFGGIVLGAGLGLVFRGGGSTGGTDIIGQVWASHSSLSTGTAILIVDFVIISCAGLAFRNFEAALYGYLNLYIHAKVIDLVLEGLSFTRAVFIISDAADQISEAIINQMGRGSTIIPARGAYTQAHKNIAFTVMSKREVARVREIARVIDPKAFIIITDVYEVLGEGFKPRGS
jgi:uncharacterized membrane-anchored protein YitT (DUF2179 family)